MRGEYAVGLLGGKDLDEAFGGVVSARAAVGGEGKFAHPVCDPGLLELLLGFADRGDLRRSIDDAGNRVIVDVAGLTGEHLDADRAFVLRLVRQHCARNAVADGVDAVDRGLEPVVAIGSASCRERVCPYVYISVVAGSLKK